MSSTSNLYRHYTDARFIFIFYILVCVVYKCVESYMEPPFEEMRRFRFLSSSFSSPSAVSFYWFVRHDRAAAQCVHDSLLSIVAFPLIRFFFSSLPSIGVVRVAWRRRHTHYLWAAPAIDQVEAINTSAELVSLLVERAVLNLSLWGEPVTLDTPITKSIVGVERDVVGDQWGNVSLSVDLR